MRLATFAVVAALAATPVLADPITSDSTGVPSPQANPNVDGQTAAADTARQNFYKDKLDAANAQAQADSATADRDAAQDRAAQDRADAHAAEGQ